MTLETIANRIVTDPLFASRLINDPMMTVKEEAIELSEADYDALVIFFADPRCRQFVMADPGTGPIGEPWAA